MRYRKRPVEIEAIRWDGDNEDEIAGFLGDDLLRVEYGVEVRTLEGSLFAAEGDYIVRGVHGEHYPVKPEIFEQTYEPIGG